MKLNLHDVEFWRIKNTPKWAENVNGMLRAEYRPSAVYFLHEAINRRAGILPKLELQNALSTLKSVRESGTYSLVDYMRITRLEFPEMRRRQNIYSRWIRKIQAR